MFNLASFQEQSQDLCGSSPFCGLTRLDASKTEKVVFKLYFYIDEMNRANVCLVIQ